MRRRPRKNISATRSLPKLLLGFVVLSLEIKLHFSTAYSFEAPLTKAGGDGILKGSGGRSLYKILFT